MSRIIPIHYRKLVKVFEKDGWKFHNQTGSHIHFVKSGFERPVTIPTYKLVPVFIIKNNMETAKMSRQRYLELLQKV
ncbi:type II toxin-antitoxin system HicA family toxin [Candidatus Curtissbacteria bacterium]|nr:type II toxin-antitoxin system HicA family toxin [Candidatus Curtissbacteria bacterium]